MLGITNFTSSNNTSIDIYLGSETSSQSIEIRIWTKVFNITAAPNSTF